ncbi:variable surface protein [Plasmodium gonderi]|uniref:Variable surface protein n=1 Tax=Plasmodium gonderi TaxID=77519 RepID=A0A1Y1JRV2_PLAGO|nr:variable surface protein [Plasmodium gonderi]GAW83203.1 variable surface protein [Plasmodium gonderi]
MVLEPSSDFIETELPSKKFYQALTDYSDFIENEAYCNTIDHVGNKKIQVKTLCSKFLHLLQEKKNILEQADVKGMQCYLLSYWMYEQIESIYATEKGTPIIIIYGEFQRIFTQIFKDELKINSQLCNLDFNIASYRPWKKVKELCDYYVDYDHLHSKITPTNGNCKAYRDYILGKSNLYYDYPMNCINHSGLKCPDFYDKLLSYNPKKLLGTITCDPVIPKKQKTLDITPKTYGGATTSGKVLLGIVITSVLFVFSYRFSPLGRQLQNNFPHITNMIRNFREKGKRLFSVTPEKYNPFREYLEENYIGYNAA